jgi:adenosylmethionine-8-amino-7-oxononanoate aminotransferase
MELVIDRASKRPFPASRNLWSEIKARAMAEGLICYPSGGTADGVDGDHVLIAPPYMITAEEVEELVDRLARAIDSSLGEARAKPA